jgi:hypothetical protein
MKADIITDPSKNHLTAIFIFIIFSIARDIKVKIQLLCGKGIMLPAGVGGPIFTNCTADVCWTLVLLLFDRDAAQTSIKSDAFW